MRSASTGDSSLVGLPAPPGLSVFPTGHPTFSNDFALDPSETLLAVCGNDGSVQVFARRVDPTGQAVWDNCCTLTDHVGPVQRCTWCAGQSVPILATVGADRGIMVFHFQRVSQGEGFTLRPTRWGPITRGHEKDVVMDIAFAPPGQSPISLLTTASLDGRVRVYEVKPNAPLDRVAGWWPDPPSGVSALSWCPGRTESCMTLAAGCLSGRCVVAHCNSHREFVEVTLAGEVPMECTGPVMDVVWATPIGRRFSLFAYCSRSEVFIIRLEVISPAMLRTDVPEPVKVFRSAGGGGCCLSWSACATALFVASDSAALRCLLLRDPTQHQSWEEVLI